MPYVDVMPLQPPFDRDVIVAEFESIAKPLAISEADYDRITEMFGAAPEGRTVLLSSSPDGVHIRIEVLAS